MKNVLLWAFRSVEARIPRSTAPTLSPSTAHTVRLLTCSGRFSARLCSKTSLAKVWCGSTLTRTAITFSQLSNVTDVIIQTSRSDSCRTKHLRGGVIRLQPSFLEGGEKRNNQ